MAPADRARTWGSDVSDFRVELPKRVFVPGEVVRGTLHLTTDAPVACRGLHIRLEHKAVVHWHYGDGDNRKDYHAEQARLSWRASHGSCRTERESHRFSATRWSSAPCGAPCSAPRR
jgi:hypothetical protein